MQRIGALIAANFGAQGPSRVRRLCLEPREIGGKPSLRVNVVHLGHGDHGIREGRMVAAVFRSREKP